MTKPLRVALIGAGGIGSLRAWAVSQTPDLVLTAVVDLDPGRREQVASRYNARAVDDFGQVVHGEDIDVVLVSTPPNLHASMAIAALQAGKHVLCEKPLATNVEDARQMCAIAEEKAVFLKTGFNHRYFPCMAFARRLIDSGQIGEPIHVKACAGHAGGEEFGHDWVHDATVTGGGSLVDNGIHILDLVRFFLGDDEPVAARGYTANLIWPFENAEDNAFALLRTRQGKIVHLHASWTRWPGYYFGVEVFCTRGYVKASYPPMLVEWGATPEPGIRSKRKFNVFPVFQIKERLRGWQWTVVETLAQEMHDFGDGIRSGRPVPATGYDGLRALQMAHAIYRSAQEGIEVHV
jgi:predicted dehydrogenase